MYSSFETLELEQEKLVQHELYSRIQNVQDLRLFMEYHVFAVWDFMSLLKSLQRSITTVTLPWKPSPYSSRLVRLINQIVVGEESDLDQNQQPCSHFELYLRAMEEVGADTSKVKSFLVNLDRHQIPEGAREFVQSNLELASNGHVVEVAAAFFFGREKLIPDMFRSLVSLLEREGLSAPTFHFYLERHIEVDGDEHGPLAQSCLHELISGDSELMHLCYQSGLKALRMRRNLWDQVASQLLSCKIK